MFDFYNLGFQLGYLKEVDIKEATDWKILTPEEYKSITGKKYAK